MFKILITGGNGLIGSAVAELLSKEHKITVLDLTKNENFASAVFDVTEKDWIDSVGKFDYVFHFASLGDSIHKTSRPINLIHTELTGLYNVLNYALKYNSKKIIFASTAILSEEFKNSFSFPKINSNPYFSFVAAKMMAEYYIEEFHRENNIGYSIVRYYNVYGKNQNNTAVVPRFIRNAIEGSPIVVFGSGKQERDFTYNYDFAKAAILTAFSEETYSKTINIGTGKKTSIMSLAKLIKKLTNSKSEIIKDVFPQGLDELETQRIPFSSSELKKLIGFECKTSLEEGLKKVIDSIEGK